MTFFFVVVGLKARREFDMGEPRDPRRPVPPLVADVGGHPLGPRPRSPLTRLTG